LAIFGTHGCATATCAGITTCARRRAAGSRSTATSNWWRDLAHAANATRRADLKHTNRTGAAIRVGGAAATGDLASFGSRELGANEIAGCIRQAGEVQASAAVEACGAGFIFFATFAKTIAAWNSERIQLTKFELFVGVAATLRRGRGIFALVVFEVADIALRIATHGISAAPKLRACILFAGYISLTRQTGTCDAAAISIFVAQFTVNSAALCRLANRNARGPIRCAETAAAFPTAIAQLAMDFTATGGARLGRTARAERGAVGDRADPGTTVGIFAANIAALHTEGSADLAEAAIAQTGTAIAALRAGIAGRLTGSRKRRALVGVAAAAAALRCCLAGLPVLNTGVGAACTAGTA